MPYGVRTKRKGRGPERLLGVKTRVRSRTPSRMGIRTSIESKSAAATWAAPRAGPRSAARSRRWFRRIGSLLPPDPGRGQWIAGIPGMPDPPLAVLADHPGEPGGGVPPVGLHGPLGRRRASAGDGADDHPVLPHRGRELVHQRADVEPGVALHLRFDGVVQ